MKKMMLTFAALIVSAGFTNAQTGATVAREIGQTVRTSIEVGGQVSIAKERTKQVGIEQTEETKRRGMETNRDVDVAAVITDGNVQIANANARAQERGYAAQERIAEIQAGVQRRQAERSNAPRVTSRGSMGKGPMIR